jgi:hypothetical protein
MTTAPLVEIVGGSGIVALIAIVGFQLLGSARAADRHLTRAMEAPPAGITQPHADSTDVPAPADSAAQQIFVQLQNYYAANIQQGATIFWATLLAMCIGFAIIFIGVVAAGTNGTTAIVAAIAGVLSQFVAATFLVALRSTQTQATTYAQTLVELRLRDVARAADARSIDLGLELLREISGDRTNPANSTKAAIAMGLIVRQPPTVIEPPAVEAPPVAGGTMLEPRARATTITFDDASAPERR